MKVRYKSCEVYVHNLIIVNDTQEDRQVVREIESFSELGPILFKWRKHMMFLRSIGGWNSNDFQWIYDLNTGNTGNSLSAEE